MASGVMPSTPHSPSSTCDDRYLMANRPSEGSRATCRALDDRSRLAPRTAQQLRALAAVREAGRVGRDTPN
jgi:hypothetical protein